jgi:hypothetical protein
MRLLLQYYDATSHCRLELNMTKRDQKADHVARNLFGLEIWTFCFKAVISDCAIQKCVKFYYSGPSAGRVYIPLLWILNMMIPPGGTKIVEQGSWTTSCMYAPIILSPCLRPVKLFSTHHQHFKVLTLFHSELKFAADWSNSQLIWYGESWWW